MLGYLVGRWLCFTSTHITMSLQPLAGPRFQVFPTCFLARDMREPRKLLQRRGKI